VTVAAESPRRLGKLVGWVLDVIEAFGALGVGLLVALESGRRARRRRSQTRSATEG
jgi:hypothetical protein